MRARLRLLMYLLAASFGTTAWGRAAEISADEAAARRENIRAVLARLPRTTVSADGLVRVVAADVPGDEVGYRAPILNFATREIRALSSTYRFTPPDAREPLIVIYALDGVTNDTRVVARARRRPDAPVSTRIWLPSPAFADLEVLRIEIATAYLRACGFDFPAWLVQGLRRGTDIDMAHADTRFVLHLWSTARLPFFPALCTDLRVTSGKGAALAGYVAGWMKEKKLFDVWRKRFAAGEKWDGRRLAADLTGETEPVRQDRASDERLVRLTNSVLSPGSASPWDATVFSSRLLLYPPFFDKIYDTDRTLCTFDEAIDRVPSDPELRRVAFRKAREVPLYALGRGDALAAAAFAYRDFLLALAQEHAEPARQRELLRVARERLRQVTEKMDFDED